MKLDVYKFKRIKKLAWIHMGYHGYPDPAVSRLIGEDVSIMSVVIPNRGVTHLRVGDD